MTDHTFSILPVITLPQRRARLWQGRSEAKSVGHEAKRSALARAPEARQFTGREDGDSWDLQVLRTEAFEYKFSRKPVGLRYIKSPKSLTRKAIMSLYIRKTYGFGAKFIRQKLCYTRLINVLRRYVSKFLVMDCVKFPYWGSILLIPVAECVKKHVVSDKHVTAKGEDTLSSRISTFVLRIALQALCLEYLRESGSHRGSISIVQRVGCAADLKPNK